MVIRKALGISALSEVAAFLLGLVNVVVVSRLLRPEEIGVFSVSVSVLGLAHIFREFGVGQYLVQAPKVDRMEFRAAFTVAIISSWIIACVLYVIRVPMSIWYQHSGIAEVLGLLALNFIIMPFGTPQLSMLRRELKFDKLALMVLVSSVIQTGVTIFAAANGESYRSMAWGSIAAQIGNMLLMNYLRPHEALLLPTRKGLKDVLKFGSVSSATSVIGRLGGAAPDLVFGRTLGFGDVAIYSRGTGLQRMLVDRINDVVRSVHFPTFASSIRNGSDAAHLYARAAGYLVAVTAPILGVLAVLSEPLILFVFGTQWERSVKVAAVMCVAGMLVTPYTLYGLSLTAAGRLKLLVSAELIIQLTKVVAICSSIWLPLEQTVLLIGLSSVVEALVAQRALRSAFGLDLYTLLDACRRSLLLLPFTLAGPLLIMWLVALGVLQRDLQLMQISLGAVTAALGWLAGVWVLKHPIRAELEGVWTRVKRLMPSR